MQASLRGKIERVVTSWGSPAAVQVRQVHQEQELLAVHIHEKEENIPAEVQSLLQEFDDRFSVPSKLPPYRMDDHTIPLIPGAQPVIARPYRYTP